MADDDFSLGDALHIAHQCAIDASGRDHELEPGATLTDYGIKTSEKLALLKKDVRTNGAIGLPSFGRTINPNAFNEITTGSTISKLSDVIFDFSTPVAAGGPSLTARSMSARPTAAARASTRREEFSRASAVQVAMISGAVGMLIGILLGRRGR